MPLSCLNGIMCHARNPDVAKGGDFARVWTFGLETLILLLISLAVYPVGLVSRAASSSYPGQPASISRSASSNNNGAYVAASNSGGYDNSQDNNGQYDNSNDNGDYSQSNSGSAVNNAQVSSNADSYSDSGAANSNVQVVPVNSGQGSVSVDLPYAGADAGVRVMTLNTNSVGDIGNQIQITIQNLLRKFGIQMQRSAGVSFQPGQTYVVRGNGVPVRYAGHGVADLSQYQSQSSDGQGQYQNGQSQYQSGQPISVAYKVIGRPGQSSAGLAVRVASQAGDGAYAGVQSGSGSGVLSGASSSSISVPNGRVSYSGVKPVVRYTSNAVSDDGGYAGADAQQDAQVVQQNRGNGVYAPAGSNGYGQASNNGYAQQADNSDDGGQNQRVVQNIVQPAAPVRRQRVKFAASSNKKTEKSSQVAFESESEA